MADMEVGTLLIAVIAAALGAIALIGLGRLLERPLDHQRTTWIRALSTPHDDDQPPTCQN